MPAPMTRKSAVSAAATDQLTNRSVETGAVAFGGHALALDRVSITPIHLDLTNVPVLAALRRILE